MIINMSHFCAYLSPIVFLEWHIIKCVFKSQNIGIVVFVKFFHFTVDASNIEFPNSDTASSVYLTNGFSIIKIICHSKEDISGSIFPRVGHSCKGLEYFFN